MAEAFKIRHELFCSLPAVDGRGGEFSYDYEKLDAPMTQEERDDYIKKLYRNTLQVLRAGMLVPVTESHDDPDPAKKGALNSIFLKRKMDPTPHYTIVGDMNVLPEFYRKYAADLLPGLSVDIYSYGDLTAYGAGQISDYIGAVTFSGTTPVAMPWLASESAAMEPYERLSFAVHTNIKRFAAGEIEMDEAALKKLIESVIADMVPQMVADIMAKGMPAEGEPEATETETVEMASEGTITPKLLAAGGDTPAPAPEEKPVADTGKMAEMEKRLAALEGKSCAGEFARLGLAAEHKKEFEAMTQGMGIDFTVRHFEKHVAKPPTAGESPLRQVSQSQYNDADESQLRAQMASVGLPEGEIVKIIEMNRKKKGA